LSLSEIKGNDLTLDDHAKTSNHNKKEVQNESHSTSHKSHSISLDKLIEGNENFKNNTRKNQDFVTQRQELTKGQKPNYIIVTCSDSRVCPEIIFDNGLGEIFVVRTAGNVVDSVCLGSIEYAAEHLGSSYIVIMGHTACGAVTAAMAGKTESPYINSILKYIDPAVKTAKSKPAEESIMLLTAIELNVLNQIKMIKKSEIIHHLESIGNLSIIGCIYNIESGDITFLQ